MFYGKCVLYLTFINFYELLMFLYLDSIRVVTNVRIELFYCLYTINKNAFNLK